jgi:DNA-directed RNA polymerase subunit RPC12/RpoP
MLGWLGVCEPLQGLDRPAAIRYNRGMQTQCPQCNRPRDLPQDYAGRQVKCPDCGGTYRVLPHLPPASPPISDEADTAPSDVPPDRASIFDGMGIMTLGAAITALTLAVWVLGGILYNEPLDAATVIIGLVGGLGLFAAGGMVHLLSRIAGTLDRIIDLLSKK